MKHDFNKDNTSVRYEGKRYYIYESSYGGRPFRWTRRMLKEMVDRNDYDSEMKVLVEIGVGPTPHLKERYDDRHYEYSTLLNLLNEGIETIKKELQ